ncbi:MAG: OadG family transporter subunit [Desulfopila sp.]|jgi:sodium pump decarboxylase gamma subunit|nr:OadG family transporter subunit [Desulfopila sp.]
MILEGFKLMFVGMGTVVLFLCLMIVLLTLVSRLTREHTAREYEAIELERKLLAEAARAKKKREMEARTSYHSPDDEDDIAVIAAAIAAFEAERLHAC